MVMISTTLWYFFLVHYYITMGVVSDKRIQFKNYTMTTSGHMTVNVLKCY